ncbi:MAG TPA: helix-turn-helix domain-containing protein [Chloroflexaceae bacterium]|nr:helix-turn-helix domain-containing protein [Chloroflexaceae bacterium]
MRHDADRSPTPPVRFQIVTDDGPQPIYLTYAEVAKRWKCSKSTIRRRVKAGILETVFDNGLLRVTLDSVLAYENATRKPRRSSCPEA